MITFKSVGHFLAKSFEAINATITKVEASAGTVEAVTAQIPVYGTLALPMEKLGYAVLGELAAVITAGGAAAKAKLADAGLDIAVITSVEALLTGVPQIAAVAKTL